mgnify:CR=1 FL=1
MFSAYNYPSSCSSVEFYRGPVLRSLSDNLSEYFEDALIVTQKNGQKADRSHWRGNKGSQRVEIGFIYLEEKYGSSHARLF